MKLTTEQKEQRDQTLALQEQADHVESLVEAIRGFSGIKIPEPKVTVNVPASAPVNLRPEIKVSVPEQPAPKVQITHKAVAYECKITSRDGNGDIKTFTLTPIE